MTSMLLILAAGIVDKSVMVVGIPSISTSMFLLPRIEISSFCIDTEEEVLRMSRALPLDEAMFADALIVVCSTVDLCETAVDETTTSSSITTFSFNIISPMSKVALSGISLISSLT